MMKFTLVHRTEPFFPPPMWGIWLPLKGWLWAVDKEGKRQVYTEANKRIAKNTARRCSRKARVCFIDNSLRDLEAYLLAVEKEQAEIKKNKKANHAK